MDDLADTARAKHARQTYESCRERAEQCEQDADHRQAAKYYRKAAEAMDKLAAVESSREVVQEYESVATSLREAADHQQQLSENWTKSPDGDGRSSQRSTRRGDEGTNPTRRQTVEEGADEADSASAFLQDPPNLTFDDVGGMEDVKQRLLSKVADPIERRDLYEQYDLHPTSGILLHGPPGTGKTYLSKALAGYLDWNYIYIRPSDITSSLVGEASKNVQELFEVARDNAPCLVFIDEIDSIASERASSTQSTQSEQQMVTQFLVELSDLGDDDDVVTVGATNHLEAVDDALLNPTRFPEVLEVPPPDAEAREAILRVHLRQRPTVPESLNWETVRKQTDGYSASDLERVTKEAAHVALDEVGPEGDVQPIAQRHIDAALDAVEPSLTKMTSHNE